MDNDLTEIRRAAFEAFVARYPSQEQAAAVLGISPVYVSFVLTKRKRLGEKLARRMEIAAGLDRGFFDRSSGDAPIGLLDILRSRMEADPGVHLLVQLILDDPATPIPLGIRDTLKTMLEGLKKAVIDAAQANRPGPAVASPPPAKLAQSAKR